MVVPDKPPAAAQPQASAREAYQFPTSIELSYNATVVRDGQPLQGSGSLQWKSDGSSYEVRLQSTALFVNLLTWVSTGTVGAQGLQPDKFSDKRVRRSEQAAHFERDKARISFSNNRTPVALQGGAQDRTSVSIQLAALLAGAPERYTQGNSISLQVASADEADVWVFNIEGTEPLGVPAGNTQAIHLTRNPRREFDARLEFWFAPALNYLPIRIKQTEPNGNGFDLVLRSPTLRPIP